ncbi:MAG: 50S ribosomal protein L11 methyltransferase [Clostridia bacterium]|nr:50S ribosomal protein L11 methyltransferase [Clostridia bacterium]
MSSDWTEFTFKVAHKDLDTVSSVAEMCVSGGIYVEDYSDFEEVVSGFAPDELVSDELLALAKDRQNATVHVYISPEDDPAEALTFITERLRAAGVKFETGENTVREEDWANNWKQYFKPLPVGKRLIVVPTWDDSVPEEYAERTKILMDPGMAFGSGQHETTRLCLEMIEKHLKPGSKVLDVGTGSGILAIGALLLGAEYAAGIDIDPLAVKVSTENAARSGLGDKFKAYCCDLAGDIDGQFELIVANIVADIVLKLIPDTGRLLAKGGKLILSGIITERRGDVEKGLEAAGYRVTDSKELGGWVALAANKMAN